MKSLNIEVVLESLKLQRKSIKINGKYLHTPFFLTGPQSKVDLDIICEMINRSSDDNDYIANLGGLCLKIVDHNNVIKERDLASRQHTLNSASELLGSSDPAYTYLKTKLKIVDPCMDLYRNRYMTAIESYLKLRDIPEYLRNYFDGVKIIKTGKGLNKRLERLHRAFWEYLFISDVGRDGIERQKVGHFIKWHEKRQIEEMKADIFLPPTPFITFESRQFLVNKAIEINKDSQELSRSDVATLFNIHSKLFKCRNSILKILEFISSNPSKTQFTVFKIWEPEKITKFELGEYGLRNFEFFLDTIRDIRIVEEGTKDTHIFGLINGGGFGYCLLGAGFDFFFDPVGNYEYYIPGLPRPKHRSLLNPRTLKPESFESSTNLLKDYGKEVLSFHPSKKYRNFKNLEEEELDSREWSKDVKRHNINLWNQLTNELIVNMGDVNKFDSNFLDRVENSAFSALSPIIRRVTE